MADRPRRNQWTLHAREEVLLALAEHGNGRLACIGVGLTAQSAHHLRRRDAGFAARWDAAIAKARAAQAARLAAAGRQVTLMRDYRPRHDGWTERRQQMFLRALAETGCVREACARSKISSNSAYRMRGRSAAFARAWERALAKVAPTIEQAVFQRAVEGWDEVVWRGGEEVSRKRRYSDSLLRLLYLSVTKDAGNAASAAGAGGGTKRAAARRSEPDDETRDLTRRDLALRYPRATEEETNQALCKKLDAVEKRMRGEAAQRHEEEWAIWCKCWASLGRPGWGRVSRIEPAADEVSE